jgi:nitroreductase
MLYMEAQLETFKAVQTVLAVRKYQDKPVPAETVRHIVEAAHLTGSSMNRQPWHFIVVQDHAVLQKMGDLAHTGRYIAQAALAVAVVIEDSPYAVSDASRAIQSMVIAAWSEGVGSNWVGFFGLEAIKPLLGVPEGMQVFAVVSFGYPLDAIGRGRKKRKPLAEIAHRERFGQPFE